MPLRRVAALRHVRATRAKDKDVVPHRIRNALSRVVFRVFQLVLGVARSHGGDELHRVLDSRLHNFHFDWVFRGNFNILVLLLGAFDHRNFSVVLLNLLLLFGGQFRGGLLVRHGQLLHRFVGGRKKRASGFDLSAFFFGLLRNLLFRVEQGGGPPSPIEERADVFLLLGERLRLLQLILLLLEKLFSLQLLFLSFCFFVVFRFLFGGETFFLRVRLSRFLDFFLQYVNLFLLQTHHLFLGGFFLGRRRRFLRFFFFFFFFFFFVVLVSSGGRLLGRRLLRGRGLGLFVRQSRLLLEELFLRRRHLRPVFKLALLLLHLLRFLLLLLFLLRDWFFSSLNFFLHDFDIGVPAFRLDPDIGHKVLRVRFLV